MRKTLKRSSVVGRVQRVEQQVVGRTDERWAAINAACFAAKHLPTPRIT